MGIFGNFFRNKAREAVASVNDKPEGKFAMAVPLGLVPGSIYTVPEIELAVAQTEGSFVSNLKGDYVVKTVGKSKIFALDVYTVRFDDPTFFVQVVCTANNHKDVLQMRLFDLYKTITPQSVVDWEFWLGGVKRDESGAIMYDAMGRAIKGEPALIGYPPFQIDEPQATVYNRQWPSTVDEPQKVTELVEDATGSQTQIKHECMEYARKLSNAKDATVEYLFVTALGDKGQVQVYLGFDLDITNQKIISVA